MSSTNIKQTYNLECPCKSSRLSAKKSTNKPTAEQVVGESLVVTEPLTDLTGTSICYKAIGAPSIFLQKLT